MTTAVLALTVQGTRLAAAISHSLEADVFVKEAHEGLLPEDVPQKQRHPFTDFGKMMEQAFLHYEALVCIMACGIVVRSLAPHLQGKDQDPAVVVVDEKGQFAISLLSGHIGGANDLARKVAFLTGGTPVITTATDVQGLPAFDELAVKNNCAIENLQALKWVSAALLRGDNICLYTDVPIKGPQPANIILKDLEALAEFEEMEGQREVGVALTNKGIPHLRDKDREDKTLILRPRNLVLGIGCKKGKPLAEMREAVRDFLSKEGKSPLSLRCMASIDLKAKEPGLLAFAAAHKLPFHTYSPQEISVIEDQFPASDFVRQTTGVGSVAEACATLAGKSGRLIAGKTVYKGITLALWEEETLFYTQPQNHKEKE